MSNVLRKERKYSEFCGEKNDRFYNREKCSLMKAVKCQPWLHGEQ